MTHDAIVRVGDGRGFVVRHGGKRLVLTAAHCLPLDDKGNLKIPPPHPWSYLSERTYPTLLGPLDVEPTVWAECLFVDPVADIAVLGCPDYEELSDEADAYEALIEWRKPLPIADAPKMGRKRVAYGTRFDVDKPGRGAARVLSLAGEWIDCTVTRRGTSLGVEDEGVVEGGMSGSPIINVAGRAMALMSNDIVCPVLRDNLPAWFFRREWRTA
jgi:hypothetical protein